MTITNINLTGKEEFVQGSQQGKNREQIETILSIGFTKQPGAFFDGRLSKEELSSEGLHEKAKSIVDSTTSNHAEFIANALGETDASLLEEQGVEASKEDVEVMVTVVDKIQLEMAKSGKTDVVTTSLSAEQIKEVVGNSAIAYEMASQLKNMTKEEAAYLINNEMQPTIANIYQAQSSTYAGGEIIPLEREVAGKIDERVAEIVGAKPSDVSTEDRELAQWMVSAGVEFTEESFLYAKELMQLELPLSEDAVSEAVWAASVSGNAATEGMLLPGYDLVSRAEEGARIIEAATPEQVAYLIDSSKDITIRELAKLQDSNDKFNRDIISENADVALVKAKRVLEETRLYMTSKANLALLKKGIQIETQPLEELVENLKQQEQELIKAIYGGNEEGEGIFSATKQELRQFAEAPAYALPHIRFTDMTISEAVSVGKERAVELQKANLSYETMMTQPRRDLGDNIQKAFRNTDAILEDLGMEVTESNERAVRILGYNEMEITRDAVMSMKLKDEQVQLLFSNMTPRVVLSMIREGYNPLQVSLEELNNKAAEMNRSMDKNGYDSYGKFLVELEQRKEITAEERESYIGIYRLLHQVAQTDGAAIGALVKAEEELTMKNLMTQVRNKRSGGFEKVVDESVGVHSEEFAADTSITMQIEAAYQAVCVQDALKQISVSKMEEANKSKDIHQMTPEQILEAFRQAQKTQTEAETLEYILKQEQGIVRRAAMAEPQVMEMLQNMDMPKSPENIVALWEMLSDRNHLFKTLFNEKDKKDDLQEAIREIKETLWKDFAEALSTPEEMAEAQEKLAETAENVMKGMLEDTELTSIDLRQLQRMSTQMEIMSARSKREEYAVPIMVSDEYGMVSLKIVRGEKEEGKVSIALELGSGDKIAAAFSAQKDSLQGYVVSDSEEVLEQLKQADTALRSSISQYAGIKLQEGNVAYVLSRELSLNQFESGINLENREKEREGVQTKTLYGVAKGFLLNLSKISF